MLRMFYTRWTRFQKTFYIKVIQQEIILDGILINIKTFEFKNDLWKVESMRKIEITCTMKTSK